MIKIIMLKLLLNTPMIWVIYTEEYDPNENISIIDRI